jgi:hypothetical protein
MGTAVGGSEDVFRVKHDRDLCEFGISGMCTVNLLTMFFKVLVPDWHIILEATERRDLTNVIELPTLTKWTPETDLSQDTRKIKPPVRVIEERGGGTFIRRDDHLQRLLDYQIELQRDVRLGAGLWDGNRTVDPWLTVPVTQAQSAQDHIEHPEAHIRERLQDISPNWAWPLFNSAGHKYHGEVYRS